MTQPDIKGRPAPVKQLIASARRPERSVPVCLHPDLTAQMQRLERELQSAERERSASDSLASGTRSRELAEQMVRLREEMLAHTMDFILRALPRRKFTALIAEHPPRDGVERDASLGVNEESFFEVLVRGCLVAPELDDEDWQRLLDEVFSDGQWEALTNAAWGVNRRDVDVPFSPLASRILGISSTE